MKPGDPLIYGVRNGICVAVYPDALDGRTMGGPRGLIRAGYQEDGKFHLSPSVLEQGRRRVALSRDVRRGSSADGVASVRKSR